MKSTVHKLPLTIFFHNFKFSFLKNSKPPFGSTGVVYLATVTHLLSIPTPQLVEQGM